MRYGAETPVLQGTQISMVIAQVGLPSDQLSTVTALVGSAPNLGGVLGVGIIGTSTSSFVKMLHIAHSHIYP